MRCFILRRDVALLRMVWRAWYYVSVILNSSDKMTFWKYHLNWVHHTLHIIYSCFGTSWHDVVTPHLHAKKKGEICLSWIWRSRLLECLNFKQSDTEIFLRQQLWKIYKENIFTSIGYLGCIIQMESVECLSCKLDMIETVMRTALLSFKHEPETEKLTLSVLRQLG